MPKVIELQCTECSFLKRIRPEMGLDPAVEVMQHGEETGHIINITINEN